MKAFLNFCSKELIVPAILLLSTTTWANPSSDSTKIESLSFLADSRIQINGDSTMKKFSAVASTMSLRGTAKRTADSSGKLPWTPIAVEMVLAVEDLKSGDATLDKHMYENLKMEKHHEIKLNLSNFSFTENSRGANEVVASGTLTVAGISKPVELNATLTVEGEKLRISGNKTVLMSDFGIEPPTMMLGILKTRNEISVNFYVTCLTNNTVKD